MSVSLLDELKMNKFLGEQLLEFNKETVDQYRENWGTILNFVHADPGT